MDRAVHVAATGFLSFSLAANILSFAATSSLATEVDGTKNMQMMQRIRVEQVVPLMRKSRFELGASDFTVALQDFVPVAMQGVTKGGTQVGRSGWEDVVLLRHAVHCKRLLFHTLIGHHLSQV